MGIKIRVVCRNSEMTSQAAMLCRHRATVTSSDEHAIHSQEEEEEEEEGPWGGAAIQTHSHALLSHVPPPILKDIHISY
ncbi:hypothetical protein Pmani_024508 [Petrolisthes manimaculis]|uniref:Uncharacterized protein n=1 Tax=Petrolisthes manimaculis TaxID=1843537 RepID=A0AAE1U278_9EUCA|nr:hypothetical protein Pmani_024508 [Petrolisthes manimaculis]